jgi:hypothetical protein
MLNNSMVKWTLIQILGPQYLDFLKFISRVARDCVFELVSFLFVSFDSPNHFTSFIVF